MSPHGRSVSHGTERRYFSPGYIYLCDHTQRIPPSILGSVKSPDVVASLSPAMTSDLESSLGLLFLNDYASLVIITAVVYDYILTFSGEIAYIWCRPWTYVSALFILIRYVGLCWVVTSALLCSTFAPGPLERCKHINSLPSAMPKRVFLFAADLVMILRVYAMWFQSTTVLCILLFVYALQVVTSTVFIAIYNDPDTYFPVTVVQIHKFTICNASIVNVSPMHIMFPVIPRFLLAATLITLAIFPTLKQSFEKYKATKCWQLNRYMQELTSDGILYFLAMFFLSTSRNVSYQIASVLNQGEASPNSTSMLFLSVFIYTIFYPLTPRFIIGIRQLYDSDISGRPQGIDSGFGMLSRPNAGTMSSISFADDNLPWHPAMEDDKDDKDSFSVKVIEEGMGQV
ncbi:hypothetical protein HD554DRAFT_2327125 [Boletus coccyginus]|nr:hypothetical protein HD554DRAFT_2327125 [Boletus coccyginus]